MSRPPGPFVRGVAPLALAALLLPSGLRAETPPPAGVAAGTGSAPGWQMARQDLELDVAGGFLGGMRTLHTAGGMLLVDARYRRREKRDGLVLDLPAHLSHRQTLGTSLSELDVGAGARLKKRLNQDLRGKLLADLGLVWRPGWLDEYQPAGGGLDPTPRRSHFDAKVGGQLLTDLVRWHHARLKAWAAWSNYYDDPNYDPVGRPTHLVPGDHLELATDDAWYYRRGALRLEAGVFLAWRDYYKQYARDAGTGRTHAARGGPPPNPRFQLVVVEPRFEARRTFADKTLELEGRLGLEQRWDVYDGYYSSTAPRPMVRIRWRPTQAFEASLENESRLRWYGTNSYAVGTNHPPLAWGSRRQDHRNVTRLSLGWTLGPSLGLFAEGSFIVRETNFPDYVPGVYPQARSYDIEWSYTNTRVMLGVRYRM